MGNRRLGLGRIEKLIENLKRELSLGGSTLVGAKKKLISCGNTTTTLTADDSGAICILDNSAASTIVLPAPQVGLEFTVITVVSAAANHTIKTNTLNTDGFLGGVTVSSTTASKNAAFAADADGSNDFITLGVSSNSTGGASGSRLHLVCLDGENWAVEGQLVGVGATMATPFGDAEQ